MKLNTIITIDEVKTLVRPVSKHLDESRIAIYIEEAENLDLKHQIGDALFIDLKEFLSGVSAFDRTFDKTFGSDYPNYDTLLNGGTYTLKGSQKKQIQGLRKALAYYTYARMVKNNNSTLTRFGFVEKQDQYSQNIDLKERLVAEKEVRATADFYLAECIDYLFERKKHYPFVSGGKQKNKLHISTIGD